MLHQSSLENPGEPMPRVFVDLCNGLSFSTAWTLFLTEWKSFWAQKKGGKNSSLFSSPLLHSFKRKLMNHLSSLIEELLGQNSGWILHLWVKLLLCRRKLVKSAGTDLLLQYGINPRIYLHFSIIFRKSTTFFKREKTQKANLEKKEKVSFKKNYFVFLFSKAFSRIMDVKVESNWFNDTAGGEKLFSGKKVVQTFPILVTLSPTSLLRYILISI